MDDTSKEIEFSDLDTLFSSDLIDGICLDRDWEQVDNLSCEPDIENFDDMIRYYGTIAHDRRIRLGSQYKIYQIVKREIDKWNPYGLLPDAPHDEFNDESEQIAKNIDYDYDITQIANQISYVFGYSFFNEKLFSIESCMEVAKNIKSALNDQKSIDSTKEELQLLLEGVRDSYDDFVNVTMNCIREVNGGKEKLCSYIKDNPEAQTGDILDYIDDKILNLKSFKSD